MNREMLLQIAWNRYTEGWTDAHFKEAAESQSMTSNIDEFEQCEFYDKETMVSLLTPEEFKVWEQVA